MKILAAFWNAQLIFSIMYLKHPEIIYNLMLNVNKVTLTFLALWNNYIKMKGDKSRKKYFDVHSNALTTYVNQFIQNHQISISFNKSYLLSICKMKISIYSLVVIIHLKYLMQNFKLWIIRSITNRNLQHLSYPSETALDYFSHSNLYVFQEK